MLVICVHENPINTCGNTCRKKANIIWSRLPNLFLPLLNNVLYTTLDTKHVDDHTKYNDKACSRESEQSHCRVSRFQKLMHNLLTPLSTVSSTTLSCPILLLLAKIRVTMYIKPLFVLSRASSRMLVRRTRSKYV